MFFKKKKEIKEVYKPNSLQKVLNVLPFIPIALLLLALLAAKLNPIEGDAITDTTELVQGIQAPDGFYNLGDTFYSYDGKLVISVSNVMPAIPYGYVVQGSENLNMVGIDIKFEMYSDQSFSNLLIVADASNGLKRKVISFSTSDISQVARGSEAMGFILVQYFV